MPPPPPGLTGPTALELALALRRRERRVVDLVEEALASAHAHEGVAAWARLHPRRALRDARRFDALLDQGEALPPLAGVPGGVKDLDPVAFRRTQMGSRAFRWLVTPTDGPVAKRVRPMQPILGKLQTSELGVLPVTETDLHPPARNPWNPDRTSGGSSGGSSAAVAAGTLAIAQGSDGAGSIRIPSAFCGLFGHKPSRGLHPDFFGDFDVAGLSVAGCLARTVDDAAAWMDGFLGLRYAPDVPPPRSLLAQARAVPRPLRIRMVTETPLTTVPPAWQQATRRAADVLRAQGHEIVEGPPLEGVSVEAFLPLWGSLIGSIPVPNPRVLQPSTRFVRACGAGWTRERIAARARELSQVVATWWGDVDAVLTPTCASEAPRIGAWQGLSGEDVFRAAVPLGAFTAPFNVGGQAAASVPMGRDGDGMPVGVQLACRQGEDGLLLSLCRQLEQHRDGDLVG